jgi:uncharacterized protein (TIGR03435 family)
MTSTPRFAFASLFLLAMVLRGTALAQTAPLPQFDVASVKANRLMEQPSNNWRRTPGRIDYHNSQLIELIKAAWGDFSLRVEGAPDWLRTERFDVVVQFPPETPPDTLMLMLRRMLFERFHLAARVESREVPTYALIAARADRTPGPKLRPGLPECGPGNTTPLPAQCGRGVGRGTVQFGAYDMATFARVLSSLPSVGRPVADETGLTGRFSVELTYAPAPSAAPPNGDTPAESDAPSIFGALQEQLGLKLESRRGTVLALVIERVEPPAPD